MLCHGASNISKLLYKIGVVVQMLNITLICYAHILDTAYSIVTIQNSAQQAHFELELDKFFDCLIEP